MRKYSDAEVMDMLDSDIISVDMCQPSDAIYFGEAISDCDASVIGEFEQEVDSYTGDTSRYKVFAISDGHPQAHIYIKGGKNYTKACVKLLACQYFSHDEWSDTLSAEEAQSLNDFLRSPYPTPFEQGVGAVMYKVTTYWQYAILQWKLANQGIIDNILIWADEHGYAIYPKQPNYTLLEETKDEVSV